MNNPEIEFTETYLGDDVEKVDEPAPFVLDYRDIAGEASVEQIEHVIETHPGNDLDVDAFLFLIIGTETEFGRTQYVLDERDADHRAEHFGIPTDAGLAVRGLSDDVPYTSDDIIDDLGVERLSTAGTHD